MDYFLNVKFCPIGETLLTLAIIREDNVAMYVGVEGAIDQLQDDWVKGHVVPVIDKAPIPCRWVRIKDIQQKMALFFGDDPRPNFIVNWPEHLIYFHKLLIPEPGRMIAMNSYTVEMRRLSVYPSEVTPAVKDNAFWDAMVLKQKIQFPNGMKLDDLPDIQKEFLAYNPVTGDEFRQDTLDGFAMRKQFPDVPWYFNPWTGKRRDPDAAQADPFGEKIKHGD